MSKRRRALTATYLVATALLARSAVAADPWEPDEGTLFQDIPSVFSASKYDQKATDAPASVSVVTGDEIRAFGYRTLADILRAIPGFHVTNDRTFANAGVRGFNRAGDYTTRVLVLVDGHRTNDPIYDQPLIEGGHPVDVALIDRVEVVRGPSSVMYGTNAVLAVVNVITRAGRNIEGVELGVATENVDTVTLRAVLGTRLASGLEVSAGGAVDFEGGLVLDLPEFGETDAAADAATAGRVYVRASYDIVTASLALGVRDKTLPTGAWGTRIGVPGSSTRDLFGFAEVALSDRIGTTALYGRIFYDHGDYLGLYTRDDGTAAAPNVITNHDTGISDSIGAELRVDMTPIEMLRLTAGIEGRHAFRLAQHNEELGEVYTDTDGRLSSLGLFLHSEWIFHETFTLVAALRADFANAFSGELSPRAALIAKPTQTTVVKLMAGTAFRAANAYELFFEDDGVTTKAAGALAPERMASYELALEQTFGAHLRGVVSGYYWRLHDIIELTTDPKDDLLVYANGGRVTAWGIEAQLDVQLPGALTGSLAYSYQSACDEVDEQIENSPVHLAKLGLNAPIIDTRLAAALEVHVAGPRRTLAGDELPTSAVVNLTLSSKDLVRGLTLSLTAFNLLDSRYSEPGSEEHPVDTIPQPGLRVRLAVGYAF